MHLECQDYHGIRENIEDFLVFTARDIHCSCDSFVQVHQTPAETIDPFTHYWTICMYLREIALIKCVADVLCSLCNAMLVLLFVSLQVFNSS